MEDFTIHQIKDLKKLQAKYKELSKQEKDLRVIHEFALTLLHEATLDDIVWSIAKHAIAKLGFVDCVVYLLNDEKDFLIQRAAHGPKNPQELDIMNPIKIPVGQGIVGTVARTKKAEIIGDTSQDKRYILDDDFRYSEIAVPIIYGDDLIGVIDSEHPEKNFFTSRHLQLLTTIAAMSASKILHALAAEQLKQYQKELEIQVEEKTKALKKNIAQLTKINRDLESFAYATSHDLAEPLRTISSFLQLIQKREPDLSEESKEYISYAVEGAHRMRKLLEDLLTYSKARQESSEMDLLHPEAIIKDVKSNLSQLIKEKGAVLFSDATHPFKGNPAKILQLFQNIIANGIKFHHPDRRPLIEIKQTEEINHFLFEISDNGIGIEEAFFDKAFKLFGRLHTIDKYKGTGIGLAICKTIVENHGGRIWLKSKHNKGTTVFFTLNK